MSQKIYPIFNIPKSNRKSNPDQDDCIVYLGEHVSKSSTNSKSSFSSTDKTEPETNNATVIKDIKKECFERFLSRNDEESNLFQYYSQELDSTIIDENASDDDTVFHNSFAQNETKNEENGKSLSSNTEKTSDKVDDEDDDEDIKLIYDSRGLLEEIFKNTTTSLCLLLKKNLLITQTIRLF